MSVILEWADIPHHEKGGLCVVTDPMDKPSSLWPQPLPVVHKGAGI
jgi:hypothetical protein